MATQLGIYNAALRNIGEVKLVALNDDREARYTMDDVWSDNFVGKILEQGLWWFAMRAAQFNSDPTLVPPFGLAKGFEQPTDWVRTAAICSDPYYDVPITKFATEAGFWFTDIDPIYVKYISNANTYGNNLAAWPETVNDFAAAFMAWKIAPKVTANAKTPEMEKLQERLKLDARSKSAMNESAAFPPTGSWVRSRFGRSSGYYDRGNRTSLIG